MFSIEESAVKTSPAIKKQLFSEDMYILFRYLQKEAHNLACYQQLKFLILKLSLRYVCLPEKSSAIDCRGLAGCQFSHIGKEKVLKLVMRSHVLAFVFMFI